ELMEALRALEGDSPDYYVVRGLAHLAIADAKFNLAVTVDPQVLRAEAFELATQQGYRQQQADKILSQLADKYSLELEVVRDALYADLPENHILTALPEWNAEMLLDRYNLAQAQGLLYFANWLVITAHRNVPGEYRRLFH